MKKNYFPSYLLLLALFISHLVFSQSNIYEGYVIININNVGNYYYDLEQNPPNNSSFDGTNLGAFNVDTGSCTNSTTNLILNGGQNKIFKCNGDDVLDGDLYYRIYLTGFPSGTYTALPMTYSTYDGVATCGGDLQTWEIASAGVNLLSGRNPGNYTLEVYTQANYTYPTGNGTHYMNNGGANYLATFTVVDNTAPVPDVANLPNVTGQCSASVSAPSATDNCEGTITGTTSDPTSYAAQGTYTITWTYDDGNGNTSSQTQTVIVDDTVAPVPDVANLPNVTGQCSASVSAPSATDNCEGTITGTTSDPTSYSSQGTYTITWTYDDGNGNTSSQTQTVIVDDTVAPVPDVVNLPNVTGQCSASVSAPSATDNCEGIITGTTSDPTSYAAQGTYTITWTYDDGNGNTSSQTQTVIVDDTVAPVPDVANLPNVTGQCSASVSAPSATDNCEGTITGTTSDPTSYSSQGTYTITWTYDDGNGNTSSQTQTVIVDDTIAPVPDVANLPNVTGQCSASVSAPSATDNCEGIITGTTTDPTSYAAQGTYTITWTYDDGNGNTSSQTQTVIVDDTIAPVPDVVNLPNVTGQCSASVSAPSATDNCEGTITGTTSDPTSYSSQGTYTITWTYDDGNGNTSSQTQTVIVDDTVAPVPDVVNLPNVTGQCSASVSAPSATDNCEGIITGTTSDPTSYAAQGTYTITWTYDDGNGNTSSQTQTVIVDDTVAPVPDVVNLPNVTGQCSASVSAPSATDNCEGIITGTTSDPTSYAAQGTYTITWTYDDGNGNTSSQTQTVIVDDTVAPVPDVVNLPNVTGQCSASVSAPSATDNCEGIITGTTSDPTSYAAQGTYTITWTYDDGNGNTSSQTQTVIVDDTVAPVPDVVNLPNVTGQCSASVSAPSATDNCEGTITGTTSDPTSYSSQGTYTITWTYDDGNGNTSSQTQTVIVDDTVAPVPDVVNLPNVTGQCSASVSAPSATDNCEGTITGTTSDPTSYAAQGTYTITWTYDDGNGNTSSQTQTVIVDDTVAPVPDVANLPNVTGQCSASVSAPCATDNCEGTITGTTSDPTSYAAQGTYTITWTYDDGNGNTSSQTQTVIVDDTIAPVPDVVNLPNVTGQCSASVSAPSATDNCEGIITGTTSDPTSYAAQGTYTITWTYDDGNGNTSSQTQTVIVDDTVAPVPDVANLPNVTGQCSASVSAPSATDNCEGTITGTTSDPTSYAAQGTYTITWTYDDGNGNTSSQTQTVIVDDTIAPVPDVANLPNVTGQCSASVSAPSATDNCEGIITGTTTDPTSYAAQGTYTITWTYDDGNGNTSSQTQTVIVDDTIAPVPDVVNLPNVTGQCSASVSAPSATDNCEGIITGTTTDPTSYAAQGTYTITWTYDDGNGNTSSQTQTVIVDDTIAPVPDVVNLPNVTGQCSASVSAPSATDNCEGIITGTTSDPTSYSAQGTYTITWTYDDGNGNTSSQTQTVIVDDTIAPVPDVANLPNVTGQCSASVSAPSATDNCEGTITGTTSDPTSYAAQGTYTITWTYDDGNGNTSSQTQTVIVDDTVAPVPDVANLPNVTGQCSASVSAPSATDNCEGTITGTTSDPTSYAAQGTYTITWTYDDGNGNTSSQTQTVIVDDTVAPTISCPGNQTVSFDNGCAYTLPNYTSLASANDNCDTSVQITQNPIAGTIIFGNTTITLTATDDEGNFTTCTFDVIPNDSTPPNAVCQNISVNLDPDGTINISALDIDNGSNDNCGIQSISISPTSFNCSNIGNNNVTLTVTDTSGNIDTCVAVVNIQDVTPPNANCGSITVILDSITGEATISNVNALYTGTGDSCGAVTLSLAQTVFGCGDIGSNQVPLTITDPYGNSSVCNVLITVEAPTITSGTLTGIVVDPIPDTIVPASELIEVTSCPGGTSSPKDVELTLNLDGNSTINASNINTWQISNNDGITWTNVAGTAGLTQYTLLDLLSTTLVRIVIQSGDCFTISPLAIIRFLPADEPPVIVSVSNTNICLTESVTIVAESYYEYSSQFGEGGFFNSAQPEDWRVDGIDGFFPASGNTGNEPTWKETNGPKILSGIRYDSADNTKFAAANGPYYTTLETPIFNTIGMTPSEASVEFYQAYYFCNGGQGRIELSFDGGNTYTTTLTTDQGDNYTSPNNTGFTVKRISNCNNSSNGQHPTSTGLRFTSIDLSAYIGMASLRIRFVFDALGTSSCNNSNFPPDPGNTCNPIPSNFNVYSSWVLDNVGFPYAPIDEILEWTDEDGGIITTGSTVNITPITPGVQNFGVTSIVNGCRANTNDGTEFVTVNTSLAYAGKDFVPVANECGQSSITLNAYDNTRTAVQNFNDGAWDNNYVVPNVSNGDTVYPGTGVSGTWSVVNSPTSSCGATATFSSFTNPKATFTGEAGSYTLRWTLQTGCYDEVNITINSCAQIDFDGVDDFVNLKNNYILNTPFSIEAWIKPNSITGNRTIISKRNSTTSTSGYDFTLENGVLKFNWYSSSGNGSISSSNNLGTDRWYHTAVTFEGANYKLYIDGIDVGSVSGSINPPSATAGNVECLIGAMDSDYAANNNVTNHFNGWMDEVKIWNKALTVAQVRQMMNQQIMNNGAVRGEIVPLDISGLNWSDLDGYYRMDVDNCGYLTAYKGVNGRLRNISSAQQNSAPLPYTSRIDGQEWSTDDTWTNFNVWDAPNSVGIDGTTPIDWNIVRTSHNISSGDKDITVLGMISDTSNKILTIADPSTLDEYNDGQGLRVTHYLKLDGTIDLVGESQLIQDEGSVLDATSSGKLERDQQGTTNLFNYNYWSSPVNPVNITANNTNYSINSVLKDGTNTNNPINLQWTTSLNADGTTTPKTLSSRWLYVYENYPQDSYADWRELNENTLITPGLSFTMKGSGAPTSEQNYVFIGKPNNGTITTPITMNYQALVGNPYPSAIDVNEFILDNIPGSGTSSIDGTIYFWEHYISNNTHILEDYEGGYAARNLTGGVGIVTPNGISGDGSSSRTPGRYIPVGQGFFVTASPTGGNITFNNDQRVFVRESVGSSVFLRNESHASASQISNRDNIDNPKKVRIKFTSYGLVRPLLLGFLPGQASDGFDYGYDALYSDVFPNDMFWMIGDEQYVIQGVGEFDASQQFPLGIFLTNAGEVSISLLELENFETNIDVFVYDSLLQTYTSILNTDFTTVLEANDYINRFFIAFSDNDALSIVDNEFQNIVVSYLNDTDELFIKTPHTVAIKQVHLINLMGQTIQSWKHPTVSLSEVEIRIPIKHVSEGAYIIKVETDDSRNINKKVIIKY